MRMRMLLAAALMMLLPQGALQAQKSVADCQACAMVQQALADAERVTPGMKRKDVEKYFSYDGGIPFRADTRYVYPKCEYLKPRVQYEAVGSPTAGLTSPDDTVKSVSARTISYPVID